MSVPLPKKKARAEPRLLMSIPLPKKKARAEPSVPILVTILLSTIKEKKKNLTKAKLISFFQILERKVNQVANVYPPSEEES
jgi:hypothetical protein